MKTIEFKELSPKEWDKLMAIWIDKRWKGEDVKIGKFISSAKFPMSFMIYNN